MSEFEIHPDPDEDVQIFVDPDVDVQVFAEEEEAVVHVEGDAVPTPESASDVEIPQDFNPLEFEPLASPPVLPWLVGKVDGEAVWVDPAQYVGIAGDHGLLSGLADDDHVMYLHKKTYGGMGSQVPNHLHTSDSDGGTITVPASAPVGADYVTLGLSAGLTNERVLTAGTGVTLLDNGVGSTVVISAAAGGIDHGGLGGLADDDHPQYVLRSVLTANGDLPIRAAGDWSRLAVGAATRILGVTAGLPAWQAQTYVDHGSISGLADDDHTQYSLATHAFAVVGAVPARLTAGRRLTAGTGITMTDGGAGGNLTIAADNPVLNFLDLADVPSTYAGSASLFVRVKVDETGLTFGTGTSDFDQYNPSQYPAVASAYNDEFDDLSLSVNWTSFGSPDILSETAYKGFLHLTKTGSAASAGVYKTYAPGATAFTVVAKVSGNVAAAGSNQILLRLTDSSGTQIVGVGLLAGSLWITKDASSFNSGGLSYVVGNVTTIYLMIQRNTTTGYTLKVSPDGLSWYIAGTYTQAGTVGRIYINIDPQSATLVESWWDFVRVFPAQTEAIGGQPSLLGSVTLATHSHVDNTSGGDLTSYIHNSLLTTIGDIIYGSAANTPARLAIGATATILKVAAGVPTWAAGVALTKTDDTNVTATLGGSPTTALINAASITLGWTGTLAVSRGGIGVGTLLDKGVLYGQGTSAVLALALNTTATNKFLRQVSSGAPSWESVTGADISATFTAYTPTITQSGTVTSYSTNTARYIQIGKLVIATGDVVINDAGSVAASNIISISLPVTAAASGLFANGVGYLYDSSTDTLYPFSVRMSAGVTTSFTMLPVDQVMAAYGGGGLFALGTLRFNAALANSDHLGWTVIYEAA